MNARGSRSLERRPKKPSERPKLSGDAGARRGRVLALGFSIAAHLAVVAALVWQAALSSPAEPVSPPVMVSLVDLPKPPGPPDAAKGEGGSPQAAVQPAPPQPTSPAPRPVPTLVSTPVRSRAVASTPTPNAPDTQDASNISDTSDVLNDSQLAGAASAGEGASSGSSGGGGGCDTARVVQQALRRDPLVRTAVEDAHRMGKAVMLWNGDWVRSGGQEGKGLSAVREAITWSIAFAPEACRNAPVHGLVLLSLADGGTRFAIGAGEWRWSDLLGLSGSSSNH
jgi:hypothetical protein